jgi:hypothetical protein
MFENYKQLPAEEQEKIKAFHKSFRKHCKEEGRYGNLAWGFIRGFPYRRIERSHKVQKENGFEHNFPNISLLVIVFRDAMIGEADVSKEALTTWLANKEGAIPAPPPRVKVPYKKDEAAE